MTSMVVFLPLNTGLVGAFEFPDVSLVCFFLNTQRQQLITFADVVLAVTAVYSLMRQPRLTHGRRQHLHYVMGVAISDE